MLKKYTPNEFWELYDKLPKELQDALFSEHITNQIKSIAERNNIDNTNLTEIIGYVLLGIIRPERLQENLEKELNLSPEKSKDVAQEAERFILYPLKSSLASILKLDYQPKKPASETDETFHLPKSSEFPEKPELSTDISERETASEENKEDSYREPIE